MNFYKTVTQKLGLILVILGQTYLGKNLKGTKNQAFVKNLV